MAEDSKNAGGSLPDEDESMNPIEALASRLIDASLADLSLPLACPCEFGKGDRYLLEEVIGVGRDSFVYLATDRKLSSEGFPSHVAIKVHASGTSTLSEGVSARRVQHEHVVQVLDSGECADGTSFLVTELMAGGDLNGLELPLAPRKAASLMSQVARGVQALHSAGVVHGDLKPANILLTDRGVPKVADFDLAAMDSDARKGGNYAFICPEYVAKETATPAPPADIYALGGMLYFLLSNRMPNGETWDEIRNTLSTRGSVPDSLGLDVDLDQIYRRALAFDPSDRYTSAGAFAEDLDAWGEYRPLSWTKPGAVHQIRLWSRRRPVHAVVALLLSLGVIATAIGIVQASRITNQRVQEFRQKYQTTIRSIAASSNPTTATESGFFTSLVWLEYLADIPILQSDGLELSLEMRADQLVQYTQFMQDLGRGTHTNTRIGQLVLAYTLLQLDRPGEALPLLEGPLSAWREDLDPTDSVAVIIDAMRTSSDALSDVTGGTSERIAPLIAERERIESLGRYDPAIALIDRTIQVVRGS